MRTNYTAHLQVNPLAVLAAFALLTAFAAPAWGQATLSPDKIVIRCSNGHCQTRSTTLTNVGNTTITINSIEIAGKGSLVLTNNCPGTLQAGQSCSISLTASPGSSNFTDELIVNDSAPNSPQEAVVKVIAKSGS